MARIYISSTYRDLTDYREVVYRTLRQLQHDVIAMEDYVATDARPLDKCLQDVAECDLYVGIFAFSYGYVPDDGNPEHKSITELEYRKAGEVGIPRLVFIVKEGTAWPTNLLDAIVSEDHGRCIDALRTELKKEHIDSFFESPEELARKVSVAVQQQLARMRFEKLQIDWQGAYRRFIEHMRLFAGAHSDQDALRRYFHLRLQATGARGEVLPAGTWNELVTYPAKVLLTGEPGSGKTTLLLYESHRLSAEAREHPTTTPLPIYLSLKTFSGGNADTLLEMAASANQVEQNTLRTLWSSPSKPICLLFDGGDETIFRDELIEAVAELGKVLTLPNANASNGSPAELRSLVVACHPGPLQQQLTKLDPSWREFLLMSLRAGDIETMLKAFDAADLIPLLDDRLRQIICRPDLLSALAQSARDRPSNFIPRNAAEIYHLYLLHIFSSLGSQYDYQRVQRPILAHIAYTMVRNKHTTIACDDALYDGMASRLEEIHRRYYRRRRVMPSDWNAQDLHDELMRSPVVDVAAGRGKALTFSKAIYRDYFVAEYLKMIGVDSQEARELVSGLHERGDLQPLSFLLGMMPDSATLFDSVPPDAMPGAGEIWLEDRVANIPIPASIRNAYRHWCASVQACAFGENETIAMAGPIAKDRLAALRDADPRTRFEAVTELAKQQPMPANVLLEAAEDGHPLIRAVAQFALLHAGDPCAALGVENLDRSFRWHSYGGGNARIGSLTLLRVPIPMMIDLSVQITDSDIDIFTSDAEFSFIPMPPALFAAGLFAAKNVDWLELLARVRAVARESELLARLAASRHRLAEFTQQLGDRARSYAQVGFLLANDLGLWEAGEVAANFQTPSQETMKTYKELRRLFSRANQAHTLRLAHLADDAVLDVTMQVAKVEGKAVGLRVANMHGSSSDDADKATSPIVLINSSRQVETVQAGTLNGIEIGRVQYVSGMLPLCVYINDAMHVGEVRDGAVGAILVSRLKSAACPWQINASVHIDRFVNSRFVGVSVAKYQPA